MRPGSNILLCDRGEKPVSDNAARHHRDGTAVACRSGHAEPITGSFQLTGLALEIRADFPDDDVEDLLRAYSPDNYGGSVMNARSQYRGDKMSACNQRQAAEYLANALPEGGVYLYQFGAPTYYDPVHLRGLFDEFNNTATDWATHGADVPFL